MKQDRGGGGEETLRTSSTTIPYKCAELFRQNRSSAVDVSSICVGYSALC